MNNEEVKLVLEMLDELADLWRKEALESEGRGMSVDDLAYLFGGIFGEDNMLRQCRERLRALVENGDVTHE